MTVGIELAIRDLPIIGLLRHETRFVHQGGVELVVLLEELHHVLAGQEIGFSACFSM